MAALSSETKRNTQQNESVGEGVADTEDTVMNKIMEYQIICQKTYFKVKIAKSP